MKKELICWDSAVLIDWIKGDNDHPSRIEAIRDVISKKQKGSYKLAFSTLIYVEVLEGTMTPNAREKFKKFMEDRENIEVIGVDIRVAQKAGEIRNRANLKTPDAIHIATAIAIGAKIFHTFDRKLLGLSGKGEVEGILITPCTIPGESGSLGF